MSGYWSRLQTGGAPSVTRVWHNGNGLSECIGNANTLTNNGTVTTVTLGDGRTAWRLVGNTTQNLTGATITETGFYCGAVGVRFIWNGYHGADNDTRICTFGNLGIISVLIGTGGFARARVTSINGQNLTVTQDTPGTLVAGQEYCIIFQTDFSTNTATLYVNGTSVKTGTLSGWTANSSINATPTLGENTGQVQRASYDIIETFYAIGTQAAPALTPTQIAAISSADYFLDMTRPTHPASSPLTFTTRIMGGYPTQVHNVSLMRANGPNSDTPASVGTAQRTGAGTVSVADSAPGTGRKFYYLSVSSSGSVTSVSTHYGNGSPQPGGMVRGVDPVPTHPTAASFGAVVGCPVMGVIGDSRTPTQTTLNTGYRAMRGGTTENILTLGAPGSAWDDWAPGAPSVTGTWYKTDGTTATASYSLLDKYLTEAAIAGVTFTCVMLGVNDSTDPDDTSWQSRVTTTITALQNAGHTVMLLRDCGHENLNSTMQNLVDQEAFYASLASNTFYLSNDGWQQFVAAHVDTISTDGVHMSVGTVGGLTPVQIAANYIMLAAQTAITPTAVLSINSTAGTIEPGATLQKTLTLRPTNGFTGNVSIAVTGLPTGVTASLSPTSPVNIPSSSNVNVTLTLTAANNAPLVDNVDITITATANGLSSAVHLFVDVIDVTAPQVSQVVISGTAVTVTMNSIVTGNSGLSFYENGGLVPLSGSLTNVDGIVLTGTLSVSFSAGTTATWNYSQSTGNLVDAGGNEVANASGQAAINNTPSSGGGGSSIMGSPEVMVEDVVPYTPSDSALLTDTVKLSDQYGIYAETAGDIVILTAKGNTRTIPIPANGTVFVRAKKILETGTTATGIFVLDGRS